MLDPFHDFKIAAGRRPEIEVRRLLSGANSMTDLQPEGWALLNQSAAACDRSK